MSITQRFDLVYRLIWISSLDTNNQPHKIPWTATMTNQSVKTRIPDRADAVVSRKLRYFGHVVRHASLQADLMTGMAPGTRRRGRPKRGWLVDVTQWSNLSLSQAIKKARDRDVWRRMVRTAVEAASERQGHLKKKNNIRVVPSIECHHYLQREPSYYHGSSIPSE